MISSENILQSGIINSSKNLETLASLMNIGMKYQPNHIAIRSPPLTLVLDLPYS